MSVHTLVLYTLLMCETFFRIVLSYTCKESTVLCDFFVGNIVILEKDAEVKEFVFSILDFYK